MAEALLQVLIENLSSLIKGGVGLVMGVDKEMKKLESTLTTIQAVLDDAEDKQFQSKPLQNWLKKLNDITYEIEDILDECAMEFGKLERKGGLLRLKKILFSDLKLGRRMKDMAEKLDAVAAERAKFHLEEKVVLQSSEFNESRETTSFLEEPDEIRGRDEDKEKIVDILVNQVTDSQQLSVLPIIGVGGLGKTTFAQLVFNDQRVSQHFDPKLWVCVSDNLDLKVLVKAMIESATGKASDLKHLDALQRQLRQVLDQKRYLLILDDVWNENRESWIKLNRILACGSKGASVVVTTRVRLVADIMGTHPAYELGGLSEEDCFLLFKLRAFGQENEEHPNLEKIGREIVEKCAGVPLAAKALGGLLWNKREEKEWTGVRDSEIWNLPENETSILPVLRLSYHHLPSVLRRCFVYCAVFLKDSIIEKQDLIFRWMAHGCISSNKTQEVEDVGDKIWNELVLRSFFQEVKTSGGETTFKMHDLVHDLALSIMENKVPAAETESSSVSASNGRIREVYMSEDSDEDFGISCSSITARVSSLTTIENYRRSRILKLYGEEIKELPSAIGKLKHLRHLELSGSSIRSLPDTFCGLWNLQILILNDCSNLESLPKRITYMTHLRHIFLDGCYRLSHMPSRIWELTFLKTLSLFIVGHKIGNQLDELEHLNLGGKLEIKHLERVQNHEIAKKANLVEKPNLRELLLYWKDDDTSQLVNMTDYEKVLEALEPHPNLETLLIGGFRGSNLSLWMTKMEKVSKIIVENCPNCSHLSPLGNIPHLKSLHLKNLAALEYIHLEGDIRGQNSVRTKFPSLEKLKLYSLPNLKGLFKEEAGEMFPNLRRLRIENCQLLILPRLSTLEDLEARFCSPLTLSSFSNKLENLSSLFVDFDEISMTTYIPEDALEGLCNLKKLIICHTGEHNFLPEKWFRGLKSLKELRMYNCNIGSCFPEWLQHLTALEKLSIERCELEELPEEIKCLHLLKTLELWRLYKMVSLPQVLQHIPSLQSLTLASLHQLTSLPDWLGDLMSLNSLEIGYCPRLPSLPSSIQGMTNLRHLWILGCPQLERRCEKEKGEDWHKIAHIPDLCIFE